MKHANEKTLHKLVIGTTGEGKELKKQLRFGARKNSVLKFRIS
ncbi:hypothetical protein [Paenibacillus anaericanus]|nr:hypothetical protein [Paenibacillus anaericanus]